MQAMFANTYGALDFETVPNIVHELQNKPMTMTVFQLFVDVMINFLAYSPFK